MVRYEFSYDKFNDDLFIFDSISTSKGNIEIGNIILDLDSKKNIVGMQILNASDTIKIITNENISIIKKLLSNLVSCKIDIRKKNNFILINFILISNEKELSSSLSVPYIKENSFSLAYS
jgi:uncharacterized protein YuzE